MNREVSPSAAVKPSDDCNTSRDINDNLMRSPEQNHPQNVGLCVSLMWVCGSLTHKYCEIYMLLFEATVSINFFSYKDN